MQPRGFAADAASVPAARAFTRDAVVELGVTELEWAVAQIVSELATNAAIHARTTYTVTIQRKDADVRIELRDDSPRSIQQRRYDDDATPGRGTRLVAALSRSSGVEPDGSGRSCGLRSTARRTRTRCSPASTTR